MSRKQSKHKNKKTGHSDTLKGVLDITRSGMGFVAVENNPEDILVRPSDFNTAMHGDTVRIRVKGDQSRSGRKQGEITEVVKRKQMEFMGRIEISKNFAFFIVNSDKPMPDIYIPLNKLNNAANGDQAIVRIIDWEKNKKPMGEVIQVMDASDVNDQAMKEILIENGFPLVFPETVIEESERIPDMLSSAEIKKRRDFREILTFTIDPIDAKDFDDAISFQVLKNGNYEIGVHIADVSYYVQPDSELDKEAYARATSVYLPDRVSPMLPERISNELCSLRPKEDKFTFASVFEITPEGEIKSQWLGRTVIHSDHRYAYEDAQEIIETKAGIYKDEILLLNDLAQNYRKRRFKKGAINFSSQEVRFKLDEKGKPIGIVIKESKEAHQLIEEFMLLANRAVAELAGKVKIDKKEIPFPYRVHDTPDEVKLTPFITFAKKYGHTFDTSSPEGISRSFNQMLEDVKGKPEQHVLEQLGIRTMAKAIYTTENIGHYGLGFEHYCHFTSPIRRYPDIMVHRILQDVLDKTVQPDKKLEQKCKHSSDKERSAMEAERAANKYKQVEYMQDFLGEEFEGVVSGVSSFGFWVETVQHKCEGLVSISGLQDYDDFRLIEGDYSLVGLRSGRKFRMGDKVTIKIVAANLTKRQLDYEWIYPQGATSSQSANANAEGLQDPATGSGTQNQQRSAGESQRAGQSQAGGFRSDSNRRDSGHFKNRNSGKDRGGRHPGEKNRSEKHQPAKYQSDKYQSDKKQSEGSGSEKPGIEKSETANLQSEVFLSGKSQPGKSQPEKSQPEKSQPEKLQSEAHQSEKKKTEKHQSEKPQVEKHLPADSDAKDFTPEHFVAEKQPLTPDKPHSSKHPSKNQPAAAPKSRSTKTGSSKSGSTGSESSRSKGSKSGNTKSESSKPGSSGSDASKSGILKSDVSKSGIPKSDTIGPLRDKVVAKKQANNVKVVKKETGQPKAKQRKSSDLSTGDQQTDKSRAPKHKTKGTPPKSKKPKI